MDHLHAHLFPHWMCLVGVCGSISSDFLEFKKIGFDTNILSMAGYQTWASQNGTTIILSALFCFIFEKALGMPEIGGNA